MMGESTATCFLSSFSQPALEVNQGDPIRALSSSVSFGRYMSESLDWEKWSTFTHNRYKEEAERYSRPGSVAEMKAYFEAHYKKKAADRAAALNEKQNSESNLKSIPESENHDFSVMGQDSVPKDRHVGTGETGEEVKATGNVLGVLFEVRCSPCEKGRGPEDAHILNDENSLLANPVATRNQQNLVEDIQLCKAIPNSEQKVLEHTLAVKADDPQDVDHVDARNPVSNVRDLDAANEQNKMLIKVAGKLGCSGPLDKENLTTCSSKSRSRSEVPKPPVPPKLSVSLQKRKNNSANLGRTVTAEVPKPPVPPKQSVSVQKRKHNNSNLDREGTAGVPKSAVPPKPSESLQKTKHKTANIDRKGNASDMAGWKRTISSASKVFRGKPVRESVDKSPDAEATFQDNKVRSKSPIVACSFRFKSEERAARRKEFFEKLEQKAKVKMTENEKLQEQTKVKATKDPKRKSESSKTLSIAMKKVSTPSKLQEICSQQPGLTTPLPCSASSGTRTPTELQDDNSRSPWRDSTLASSASAGTQTPMKPQNINSRSPWRHSTLVCSSSAGTEAPSKLQDNNSRSCWSRSTLACSSTAGTKTPSNLKDNNSRSPWKQSTLACSSSAGMKIPSQLQDNNSRSPWRHSTLACSSSAGTKTPSKLQNNDPRSPWRHSTLACASSTSTKTPSKLQDNIPWSPWKHTPLPSSSSVDRKTPSRVHDYNSISPWRRTTLAASSSCVNRKTPSRVQDNNSRPPWRLTAKSNCCKETTEKNNRSPFHIAKSVSKKSTHENSSPNIQLSRES